MDLYHTIQYMYCLFLLFSSIPCIQLWVPMFRCSCCVLQAPPPLQKGQGHSRCSCCLHVVGCRHLRLAEDTPYTSRGGQTAAAGEIRGRPTYHDPGRLVLYPIPKSRVEGLFTSDHPDPPPALLAPWQLSRSIPSCGTWTARWSMNADPHGVKSLVLCRCGTRGSQRQPQRDEGGSTS